MTTTATSPTCPTCRRELPGLGTYCHDCRRYVDADSGIKKSAESFKPPVSDKAGDTPPASVLPPLVLNVTPCPKPRMTQRDKWSKRPSVVRYREFCDELRRVVGDAIDVIPCHGIHVQFYLPMFKSWTKKKRARLDGKPHQQKPDVDNLTKAFADALWPDDDSHVWDMRATKRWATEGRIVINWNGNETEEAA